MYKVTLINEKNSKQTQVTTDKPYIKWKNYFNGKFRWRVQAVDKYGRLSKPSVWGKIKIYNKVLSKIKTGNESLSGKRKKLSKSKFRRKKYNHKKNKKYSLGLGYSYRTLKSETTAANLGLYSTLGAETSFTYKIYRNYKYFNPEVKINAELINFDNSFSSASISGNKTLLIKSEVANKFIFTSRFSSTLGIDYGQNLYLLDMGTNTLTLSKEFTPSLFTELKYKIRIKRKNLSLKTRIDYLPKKTVSNSTFESSFQITPSIELENVWRKLPLNLRLSYLTHSQKTTSYNQKNQVIQFSLVY